MPIPVTSSISHIFHTPSKSLADRLFSAEFDDALVDQIAWKNLRYDGCKITSKKINEFNTQEVASLSGVGYSFIKQPGVGIGEMMIGGSGLYTWTVGGPFALTSTNYGHHNLYKGQPGVFKINAYPPKTTWKGDTPNPTFSANIKNQTTALYIANTVIAGDEDPQYATIKKHSYLNINKIVIINPYNNETQVIDKQSLEFKPYHAFITNDLPTTSKITIRMIDDSVPHALKGPNQYKVKMNKGWLLKSFDFKYDSTFPQLTENNAMYLYKGGHTTDNFYSQGNTGLENAVSYSLDDRVRFRYGIIEMIEGGAVIPGFPLGHHLQRENIGPSFGASSIISNKFTDQYYSGSFGLINEPPSFNQFNLNSELFAATGLGSASKFIGLDSLNFLRENNINNLLTEQEKTELHITFFEGTKDFSSGSNDERSISTFEIDKNQEQLDQGGFCHKNLPKNHEITFKGINDTRFIPLTNTFQDNFINAYNTSSNSSSYEGGCVGINQWTPGIAGTTIQRGINADETKYANIYVQGGAIGQYGYVNYQSGNAGPLYGRDNLLHEDGALHSSSYTGSVSDHEYSGSFSYQLSWLDKDHVIITDLHKEVELFNGTGTNGIVIVPEHIHPTIKDNLQFYLQQAGIVIGLSPNTQILTTND